MKEDYFKQRLVGYLTQNDPTCIALEVPFLGGRRRADAVMVRDGKTYGFEIKSLFDNLDTLKDQIKDYQSIFDYVWILSAEKHIDTIRKNTSRNVGLLTISDGMILPLRKSIMRLRLSKYAILSSLDSDQLKKLAQLANIGKISRYSYHEIIKAVESRISLGEARAKLIDQIIRKYKAGYEIFKKEQGEIIHAEDLLSLGIERKLRY